ncbi:unnamed protein product [Urochloa humidicola]
MKFVKLFQANNFDASKVIKTLTDYNVDKMDLVEWAFKVVKCRSSIKFLFFELYSGIFVMKLMQSHDGDKQATPIQTNAMPLRECMAYYMLTHPLNEKYHRWPYQ